MWAESKRIKETSLKTMAVDSNGSDMVAPIPGQQGLTEAIQLIIFWREYVLFLAKGF
jgi:hypothetical protein